MKIAYSHLVSKINEKPSINKISDSLFQLGHEHEIYGDIFDIEFTPNRGDCLSVNGLLRDLAVFYTIDFKQDIYTEKLKEFPINFENKSDSICPKISFLKLEIDNITNDYREYLNSYFSDLDINKNNFFTDVSNYLSYETGQPTHCYDATNFTNGKLVFHEVNKNEEFETLLDKKIKLTKKNAVFSLNNKIVNLAGVVGGKLTSCSENTKTVIIECAYFKPEAIIGKSVQYDIKSDASHKFERGVDPECHENVLRRFIKIVSDHVNIKDMSIISFNYKNNILDKIPFDFNKINQIIGINLSEKKVTSYLTKLGFLVKEGFIIAPSFRNDIKTSNDLAEEVARAIGYNNIKSLEINIPTNTKPILKDVESKLRFFLLDHGFYEVINAPFVSLDHVNAIKVDNPLDSNKNFLRSNITNSLVQNLLYNEKRQKDSVKLFEISDIYFSKGGIHKKRYLSILASGRVGLNYQDFSRKINKEYFIKLFQEILPNEILDFKLISRESLDTKIKNEIVSLEIDIDTIPVDVINYKEISKHPMDFIQYKPISEHPSSFKDISYSIKDFSKVQELENLLLNYQNDFIKNIYIFDYFKNEKKEEIKIGFRFIFQSAQTTLKSEQIELIYNEIIQKSLKIKGIDIPGL